MMGEYAEMMLDGTCCEGCGEYMGEGHGFPQYCSDRCAEGRGVTLVPITPRVTIGCPLCKKTFGSEVSRKCHVKDKHSEGIKLALEIISEVK